MDNFSIDIKQIHLADIDLVDRCESCHLGIREPVTISKTDLGEAVFASHPNPDLFKIHDPERFGCTSCHNGNGRATSSVAKAHGNVQALAVAALQTGKLRGRLPAVPLPRGGHRRRRDAQRWAASCS